MAENLVNVNNGGFDPLQGFHTVVYVNDQATGLPVLAGGFTGFQVTAMNATERYLAFGGKNSRLLDGINAYGWTLERGMLDARVLQEVFCSQQQGSEFKANPNPRFVITVQFNASELDRAPVFYGEESRVGVGNKLDPKGSGRAARGRYQLRFAKIDNVTIAGAAGGNVIANRFEGMCEDVLFFPDANGIDASGLDNKFIAPQFSNLQVPSTNVTLSNGANRNYLFG